MEYNKIFCVDTVQIFYLISDLFYIFAALKMLRFLREVQMKKMGTFQRGENNLKSSTADIKRRNINIEANTRNINILQKKIRTKSINIGTNIRNINERKLLIYLIKKMDQENELRLI